MSKRKKPSRVYWRNGRAYGDFRQYKDVGGGLEALIPTGAGRATTSPDVANKLVADRLQELEKRRRNKHLLGIEREEGLAAFASHHLVEKKRDKQARDEHLAELERRLRTAVQYFGPERDLASISPPDVQKYAAYLHSQPNGRGGVFSGQTVKHYLNALQNMFERARFENLVVSNPVEALWNKPVIAPNESEWLEVYEAAEFLDAAREYAHGDGARYYALYVVVATCLLTGGREAEIFGLEIADISFERKTVTIRPNRWRLLKSRTSERVVPLWPQLEEILRIYLESEYRPTGRLLFPSSRGTTERPIVDIRKFLDSITRRIGRSPVRTKMFRHTYISARLQTLDRGAPVSLWTVAREVGHSTTTMIERVYGHLGMIRHRSEVVEYFMSPGEAQA